MIPLVGCQAHGGKVIQLDEDGVFTDLTNTDYTGGTAFTATFVSSRFDPSPDGGWYSLRRLALHVAHDGGVTVDCQPLRDGAESGPVISRALVSADGPEVIFPIWVPGSDFQVQLTVSAFDGTVALGNGSLYLVPRRSVR